MNTRFFVLLLSFLAIGCEEISPFISDALRGKRLDVDGDGIPRPDDCDDRNLKVGIRIWYQDVDQDGFGAGAKIIVCDMPIGATTTHTDCDDTRANVYPSASELCDHLDNDCNTQTDETFTDLDASCGVGACTGGKKICASDQVSTTCSSTTNASSESCNLIDDDCNGQTDEGTQTAYYQDADKDGFGNIALKHLRCLPLPGETTNATDCDDAHESSYPNAPEFCDGLDNDCNGQTDESTAVDAKTLFADVDQDTYGNVLVTKKSCVTESGWSLTSDDCKDLEKAIHPNALEICNMIDDDCDGQTDEGVIKIYFADADKDSYGDLSKDVTGCTIPEGFVTNSADCNDKQKSVHPNAIELCDNNIDENCDGVTDNAKEASLWYLDSDKDSYGKSTVSMYACATPTGYVSDKTDCNDADKTIYPNAIEICKDSIDNDCNGITDTDTKIVTWYLDSDKDTFGDATKSKEDCLQPVGYVKNSADCSDANASIHPEALEVCNNGTDDNCDGSVNQCFLNGVIKIGSVNVIQITGPESQNFAAAVSTCDLNDDGSPDIVIGSPAWNANQGKVSLYLAPFKSGMNPTQEILGPTNGLFGTSLACTGSKNGPMLAVGSPGLAANGNSAGALYVFMTSVLKSTSVNDANAVWIGTAQNMEVGVSCLAIPDQDKDSLDDFFVGADGYNGGAGAFAGAGFMVSSATLGTVLIQNALASFINKTKDELAGTSLAVGFVNQDTKLDFLLGAISSDVAATDAGAVYTHLGPMSGSNFTTENKAIYGISPFDTLGQSLASSFDLTGDLLDDVLIGSPGNGNAQNPGSVQIARFANATFLVTTLESTFGGDRLGYSVSSGNVNADPVGDILVSSPGADDAGFNFGSVFLQYGPILKDGDIRKTAHARIDGEVASGQLGLLTKIAPDLNGDNIPDLILVTKSTKPLRKLYILPGLGL